MNNNANINYITENDSIIDILYKKKKKKLLQKKI